MGMNDSDPQAIRRARTEEARGFFDFIAQDFPPLSTTREAVEKRLQAGWLLDYVPSGLTFKKPFYDIRNFYSLSLWFLKSKPDPDSPPYADPPTPGRWLFYPREMFIPGSGLKIKPEQEVFLKEKFPGGKWVWPEAGEITYLLTLNQKRTGEYLLETEWVRTNTPCGANNEYTIAVGFHHFDNLIVGWTKPTYRAPDLFACPVIPA